MFSSLVLCASMVHSVFSHPVVLPRQTDTDTNVLQFALTLEHLENTFYKTALSTLTRQDFTDAGFGPNYFNNIQLIAQDEASHVKFLIDALTAAGVQPVQPCTYSFPMTDVKSFVALSSILEGVGTSAYLGGAPLINNRDLLTAAGSILVTEAFHTSLQRTATKAVAGPNPFGTPLDPNAVFTLAASFITACPASNAALPFKAFPSLIAKDPVCSCEGPDCSMSFFQKRQLNPSQCLNILSKTIRSPDECNAQAIGPPATGNAIGGGATLCRPPAPGSTVAFTAADTVSAGAFLTFISGLMITSVRPQISGNMVTAVVPAGISGQSYVVVTSTDTKGKFDPATVLFGPAVLEVHPAIPGGANGTRTSSTNAKHAAPPLPAPNNTTVTATTRGNASATRRLREI